MTTTNVSDAVADAVVDATLDRATDALRNRTSGLNFFGDEVCGHVDVAFERLVELRTHAQTELADPSSVAVPIVGLVASLVVLFFGGRLFRLTAALAAGVAAFWAVYTLGRNTGERITCEALVIVSTVVALFAALAAGCIVKAGLFFIGAAALGSVVHLVYSAFPTLHDIGEQPTFAQRSLAYWGLMVAAAIAGGLALRWHSKPILEVLTALIGGAGVGYSLHSISEVAGMEQERWIFLVIGGASAFGGWMAQRQMRLRRCNRKPYPQVADRA